MIIALRLLWRDAKAGELNLLALSLVLAVVIMTSIGLFTERLQKALLAEANVFLAADAVLASDEPISDALSQAISDKLDVLLAQQDASPILQARVVQFPSMVFSDDDNLFLASVKAVSESYPLRGQLEITQKGFDSRRPNDIEKVTSGPQEGEAWLDARLLNLLEIKLGDTVWVGEQKFIASQILIREPDNSDSFWSLGPRILFNIKDLPATGIIQPGSRVRYRYLFSGDAATFNTFRLWLKQTLLKSTSTMRLINLEGEQPALAEALERAQTFLLLSASLGVLLACVAIAMAARRYSQRHFDTVAIMKTLGATPQKITQLILLQLLCVVTFTIGLGCFLGYAVHHIFLIIMQNWLPAQLPLASFQAYGLGITIGVICSLAFALPLIWQLRSVQPLRVLRRELSHAPQANKKTIAYFNLVNASYFFGVIAIFSLITFYSGNGFMTLAILAGCLACILPVAFISYFLLGGLRTVGSQAGSVWRLAVSNLQRNRAQTVTQLVIFTLVILLLLITFLIRTSIVSEWQLQLPPKTPNHFLINIAPYQIEPLEKTLKTKNLKTAGIYPMVRGRLTHINGALIDPQLKKRVPALRRSLNFTWSETLPEDNQLIAGQWWQKNASPQPISQQRTSEDHGVSVEQDLAKKLDLELGDKLTFSVGFEEQIATVESIRELDWGKMRPNFYFIFEAEALDQYAATYITSFYLPVEDKLFLNVLLKQFPTVTIFEIDEMIARIKKMISQVSQAIELVLALILLAGLLVFVACIQASLDQRIQESALLRTLGAGRQLILGSLCVEFALLGSSAGLMAVMGSEFSVYLLQTQLFKMAYAPHFSLWVWVPALTALMTLSLGLLFCKKVVQVSPLQLLRAAM